MLSEQLQVDARPVVKAVQVSGGHELHQVLIAGQIRRQQDQVVGTAVELGVLLEQPPGCLVHLTAKDRLDPCRLRGMVELDRSIHLAVIGKGERVHAQLACASAQIGQSRQAVQ